MPQGCDLHEELVDLIRFEAAVEIRQFPGFVIVTPGDGGLTTWMLRNLDPANKMRPDVWIHCDDPVELIAVEIGRVPENKWRDFCAVIHISFMGGVALVSQRGTELERHSLRCIRNTCDDFFRNRKTTDGMKVIG
jgi:hypothetical protein